MISPENRRPWVPRTAELTLAAGLAATYIITTFIPLTPFIGGPGVITLESVMAPLTAALVPAFPTLTNVFFVLLGKHPGHPQLYTLFHIPGPLIPPATCRD